MGGITKYRIIKHYNPKGKLTWYRAEFVKNDTTIKSSRYKKVRMAQNWLYATTKIWCKSVEKEQRVEQDGKSIIIPLGTEDLIV